MGCVRNIDRNMQERFATNLYTYTVILIFRKGFNTNENNICYLQTFSYLKCVRRYQSLIAFSFCRDVKKRFNLNGLLSKISAESRSGLVFVLHLRQKSTSLYFHFAWPIIT